MKWDGDEYKELKWSIFDAIKNELNSCHAGKITISKLADCIDKMFENLLDETDYKGK